jgi:hypothetical protein
MSGFGHMAARSQSRLSGIALVSATLRCATFRHSDGASRVDARSAAGPVWWTVLVTLGVVSIPTALVLCRLS